MRLRKPRRLSETRTRRTRTRTPSQRRPLTIMSSGKKSHRNTRPTCHRSCRCPWKPTTHPFCRSYQTIPRGTMAPTAFCQHRPTRKAEERRFFTSLSTSPHPRRRRLRRRRSVERVEKSRITRRTRTFRSCTRRLMLPATVPVARATRVCGIPSSAARGKGAISLRPSSRRASSFRSACG